MVVYLAKEALRKKAARDKKKDAGTYERTYTLEQLTGETSEAYEVRLTAWRDTSKKKRRSRYEKERVRDGATKRYLATGLFSRKPQNGETPEEVTARIREHNRMRLRPKRKLQSADERGTHNS